MGELLKRIRLQNILALLVPRGEITANEHASSLICTARIVRLTFIRLIAFTSKALPAFAYPALENTPPFLSLSSNLQIINALS